MIMIETFSNQTNGAPDSAKPNKNLYWPVLALIAILILGVAVYVKRSREGGPSFSTSDSNSKKTNIFIDNFKNKNQIEETGKKAESSSGNWWVNSGGRMLISGGTGKTIQGDLPRDDKWLKAYKKNNPEDTDNGLHPQNIFRLVMRDKWENFSQEVFFRIKKMNFSASENRNESNGFLLFNRYQDGDDLYYTGLRVDGYAVIKKKIGGDYHTLAYERVFKGDYNRDTSPNFLPVGKWIGIRSVVKTKSNGDVDISLFWKKRRSSKKWVLAAHCVDKGQKGDEITDSGFGGIRTDFMDVEFAKYKIKEI